MTVYLTLFLSLGAHCSALPVAPSEIVVLWTLVSGCLLKGVESGWSLIGSHCSGRNSRKSSDIGALKIIFTK